MILKQKSLANCVKTTYQGFFNEAKEIDILKMDFA